MTRGWSRLRETILVMRSANSLGCRIQQLEILFQGRHEGLVDIGQVAGGVALEKGEVDDEEGIPFAAIDPAQALTEVDSQAGQDGVGPIEIIGLEEE